MTLASLPYAYVSVVLPRFLSGDYSRESLSLYLKEMIVAYVACKRILSGDLKKQKLDISVAINKDLTFSVAVSNSFASLVKEFLFQNFVICQHCNNHDRHKFVVKSVVPKEDELHRSGISNGCLESLLDERALIDGIISPSELSPAKQAIFYRFSNNNNGADWSEDEDEGSE